VSSGVVPRLASLVAEGQMVHPSVSTRHTFVVLPKCVPICLGTSPKASSASSASCGTAPASPSQAICADEIGRS